MSRVKQYDGVYNLDIGKIVVRYDKPANGGETFQGKNPFYPVRVDLNALITNIIHMLRVSVTGIIRLFFTSKQKSP
jgi:hypothetical protein